MNSNIECGSSHASHCASVTARPFAPGTTDPRPGASRARCALRLMCALVNSDEDNVTLRWLNRPFAPWATMPDNFVFPRARFETFFAPADTLKMGDACERCGLCVPVYTFGLPDWDVKE